MVKIRMTRLGSKKSPFYRVMAIDSRKQRDGRPLEFLGIYDPRVSPPTVDLNLDAIDGWIGKGAQMSGTIRSLVNQVRRTGNNPLPPANRPAAMKAPAVAEETAGV